MINKGDAPYAHPGNVLGRIGENQKPGLFVLFHKETEEHEERAGDSGPPDDRVSHTADRADQGFAYCVVSV